MTINNKAGFILPKKMIMALLMVLISGFSKMKAQSLEYYAINFSDSTIWYVKNNSSDTLLPTSITMNWYHMKQTAMAFPLDFSGGFYNNTIQQSTIGNRYRWKYKTTFGCSISDTLFPGKPVPVSYTVNFNGSLPDTIMPANVTVFFNKPFLHEVSAVPANSTCDFRRIYLTSRWVNQGIHYYSGLYTPLNANTCQGINSGSVVVSAFNPFTYLQTPSRVLPKCSNGRFWTSFGFHKDSVLYYSFNQNDNKHLDSIVNGLDSGDYFAYASYPTVSLSALKAQAATFRKIGFDVGQLSSDLIMQIVIWGRKGLPNGKAFFTVKPTVGSVSNLTADYVMLIDQAMNELKPYADCYEKIAIIHQPYVPDKIQNHLSNTFKIKHKIWPNPLHHGSWEMDPLPFGGIYKLRSMDGRQIGKGNIEKMKTTWIESEMLPTGIYQLEILMENKQTLFYKLIKN